MEKEQKILELQKQLFEQLRKDIINLVSPFGSLKIRSVHRFVDEDLCEDIVRTKEVKIKNGQLLLLQDTWNGEGDPNETYFDDDELFHEEYWANYSKLSPVAYEKLARKPIASAVG